VLAYLARYTHRVAISNRRLIAADAKAVTFKVKDYRIDGPGRYKTMTLDAHEFIRRFLIHVLPKGFHRIRHYGLLTSGVKADNLALARKLLDAAPPAPEPEDAASDPATPNRPCPCCGSAMRIIEVFKGRRAPATQADRDARRHQDRHLMSPGNLIRRCCTPVAGRPEPRCHHRAPPRSLRRPRHQRPHPQGPPRNPHRARGTVVPHIPRVPSLEAFGRRPRCSWIGSSSGRHPKPFTIALVPRCARQVRLPLQLRSTGSLLPAFEKRQLPTFANPVTNG
jgi:hypothetical protein